MSECPAEVCGAGNSNNGGAADLTTAELAAVAHVAVVVIAATRARQPLGDALLGIVGRRVLLTAAETAGERAWLAAASACAPADVAPFAVADARARLAECGDRVDSWTPTANQLRAVHAALEKAAAQAHYADAAPPPPDQAPRPAYLYAARLAHMLAEAGALLLDVRQRARAVAAPVAAVVGGGASASAAASSAGSGTLERMAAAFQTGDYTLLNLPSVGNGVTPASKRAAAAQERLAASAAKTPALTKFFNRPARAEPAVGARAEPAAPPAPAAAAAPVALLLEGPHRLAVELFVAHQTGLQARLPVLCHDHTNDCWWQLSAGGRWVLLAGGAERALPLLRDTHARFIACVADAGAQPHALCTALFAPPADSV